MDDTDLHLKYASAGYYFVDIKHHWVWAFVGPLIVIMVGTYAAMFPDSTPDSLIDMWRPEVGVLCIFIGVMYALSRYITWLLKTNSLFSLGADAVREGREESSYSIIQSLYFCGAYGRARALQELAKYRIDCKLIKEADNNEGS